MDNQSAGGSEVVNIVFVLPNLNVGGAERVLLTITRHLDRRQFAPSLLILGDVHGTLAAEVPSDVPLVCLGYKKARHALFAMTSFLRKRNPDIVFFGMSYLNLLAVLVRPFLGKTTRIVARETNIVSLNNQSYRLPWAWNILYRLFYRRLDFIICQSKAMQQDLVSRYAVSPARTCVVSNPVECDRVRELAAYACSEVDVKPQDQADPSGMTRFVVVGGLRPEKNIACLIEAVSLAGLQQFHVDIVGDGPERGLLEKKALEFGVASQVAFRGFQSNPYGYIKRADALVLSSRNEGLPNVVLEALVLGTSVIATPAGGVLSELLAAKPGCVVSRDGTPASLAVAIDEWVAMQPCKIPDEVAAEFEASAIVASYEDIFRRWLV